MNISKSSVFVGGELAIPTSKQNACRKIACFATELHVST